jgi:glycosyltransferase involved in cell wall biosynthesis
MARRWFIDVSYSTTRGDVTGITKTTKRLLGEMQALSVKNGEPCVPVLFHNHGYRRAETPFSSSTPNPIDHSGGKSLFARLLSMAGGNLGRHIIAFLTKIIPRTFLESLWAAVSAKIYNLNSQNNEKIGFKSGDVLFIADAAWNYPAWRAATVARKQGAKVVTLIYDLMPLRHPEYCFPLLPLQFHSWLMAMSSCSDALICISKATLDDLNSWFVEQDSAKAQKEIPARGYFHLGSDQPEPQNSFIRSSLATFFSGQDPCFACIGSFEKKRNYPLILQVFNQIWREGNEVRLIFAGRITPELAEFVAMLQSHPENQRRLLVIHDACDAEISYIYQKSRALLLASSFEGFGLPLIEARSRGTIVIANQIPPFQEIADPGVFFFDLKYPISLSKLILEHSRTDYRDLFEPLIPTTWQQSAMSCQSTIKALLWKSSAPSKDPN